MKAHYSLLTRLTAAAVAMLMAGCAAGPNYHRPATATPTTWKTEAPWRTGEPRDQLQKGAWWKIFGDADLDALEAQAMTASPTLQAAVSRLDQARALARLSVAGLFPTATVGFNSQRQRVSGNRPFISTPSPFTQNNFQLPFTVTYEPDLFGRVRRNIESSRAALQASAADLENLRLLVASEVAADYFTVRALDAQLGVYASTVESLQRGLQLTERRAQGGVSSQLDVAQERTLLDSTRTQAILLGQQRAEFENALGTLTGQPASSFKLGVKPLPAAVPAIPLGVPSDLLERRPDIAEAERQMATANAQIGIAMSAYYPGVTISAGGGFQSFDISKLATLTSGFWAVGAAVAEAVLTGGARKAQVDFAKAGYTGAIANYRGTVLTAFQEVEDNLAGLSVLDQAAKSQARAVEDAQKSLEIANNRYLGGLVSYLDVVTAQQALLSNQRLASEIEGQRLVTSVLLIKALGGGWDAASIAGLQVKPSAKQAIEP